MNSTQTELTSQASSQVFEGGNHTRLASSATSNASDLNLQKPKKHPQSGKAKQVMGMDFSTKPLSKHNRIVSEDGNIAALEREYSDVFSPPKETTFALASPVKSMDEDRVKETARDIYNGTELLVPFGEAASWLMSSNDFNSRVRAAYMELFDFMGVDMLNAVRYDVHCCADSRRLCGRLFLKGETQEIDRILETLAKRWYECNTENGMKDPGMQNRFLGNNRRGACNRVLHIPSQHRSPYRRYSLLPADDSSTIRPKYLEYRAASNSSPQTH
jgi:hypothetical protein